MKRGNIGAFARIAGASVVAAVVLAGLTGCGSDNSDGGGDGGAGAGGTEAAESSPEQVQESESAEADAGMDGTWTSIVEDNDIETLTVSGDQVETTGRLACPGTLTTEGKQTRIDLTCDPANGSRDVGTVELDPEGTHLVITWDGQEWGSLIDSFTRDA